jgi:hypothetical protein
MIIVRLFDQGSTLPRADATHELTGHADLSTTESAWREQDLVRVTGIELF